MLTKQQIGNLEIARELRGDLGLSQPEFAEATGVGHGSVSQYETERIAWPGVVLLEMKQRIKNYLTDQFVERMKILEDTSDFNNLSEEGAAIIKELIEKTQG